MLTQHPPARFEHAGKRKIDLVEPSDVVFAGSGTFLVVGDLSDELLVLRADGTAARHALQGVKSTNSGLEAIAFDPERRRLFVASEERELLVRFTFDPSKDAAPVVEEKIPLDLGRPKNKGVEGMAWLPAKHSPTGTARLLVAKEQEPQALALLDGDGTGAPARIALPPSLENGCRDFSGLALDPRTGHVFVVSQESATLAELTLTRAGTGISAGVVAVTPLLGKKGRPYERVEGIAFDDRGDLYVLLENDRELHHLQRVS